MIDIIYFSDWIGYEEDLPYIKDLVDDTNEKLGNVCNLWKTSCEAEIVLDNHPDIALIDYGAVSFRGASGLSQSWTREFYKYAEENPSVMMIFISRFTNEAIKDFIEYEGREMLPNIKFLDCYLDTEGFIEIIKEMV